MRRIILPLVLMLGVLGLATQTSAVPATLKTVGSASFVWPADSTNTCRFIYRNTTTGALMTSTTKPTTYNQLIWSNDLRGFSSFGVSLGLKKTLSGLDGWPTSWANASVDSSMIVAVAVMSEAERVYTKVPTTATASGPWLVSPANGTAVEGNGLILLGADVGLRGAGTVAAPYSAINVLVQASKARTFIAPYYRVGYYISLKPIVPPTNKSANTYLGTIWESYGQ